MQIESYTSEPGQLRHYTPPKDDNCMVINDNRCPCGEYHSDEFEDVAYLTHSCNEWVIGGREDIIALMDDLQAMLDLIPTSKYSWFKKPVVINGIHVSSE